MTVSDSEFEAKIIANVEQHGCSINVVIDPDGDDPAFAYSIGFPKSVSQPEVIVFGLSSDMMQYMINETRRQCADEGLALKDRAVVGGLLEGFECILRMFRQTESLSNISTVQFGTGEPSWVKKWIGRFRLSGRERLTVYSRGMNQRIRLLSGCSQNC